MATQFRFDGKTLCSTCGFLPPSGSTRCIRCLSLARLSPELRLEAIQAESARIEKLPWKCSACRAENLRGEFVCKLCGSKRFREAATAQGDNVSSTFDAEREGVASTRPPSTSLQNWSLALGLTSIILFWIGLIPISAILLSITALAKSDSRHPGHWKAIVGICTGLFGFVMYLQYYGHL